MSLTVVKLGGGLAAACGAGVHTGACTALSDLAVRHPIVVVPGGGRFADAVRERDAREGLTAQEAHDLAIAAMDRFGEDLTGAIPGAASTADSGEARRIACHGRVAVLRPAALIGARDPLPASWDVTSDAIAAWLARGLGAARLVLVKAAPGLHASWPASGAPLATVTLDELASGAAGGVDAHLPLVLRGAALDVRVVGGADAAAALTALLAGAAVGTRILTG